MPRRAAFFDVDETLIVAKSTLDFLRFWLARRGDDGREYERLVAKRRERGRAGVPRTEIIREYFRTFAGVPYAELIADGTDWYREYSRRPDAFVGVTLAAASAHQADGDVVVLVSGSFHACLGPLAADIRVREVACSEPLVAHDGRLTGEIVRPMIGDAKAEAVAETLARLDIAASDCFAYGDHSSDLAMLSAVGSPRVVGDDPVLVASAHKHGWPVLPAMPAPRGHGAARPTGRARSRPSDAASA